MKHYLVIKGNSDRMRKLYEQWMLEKKLRKNLQKNQRFGMYHNLLKRRNLYELYNRNNPYYHKFFNAKIPSPKHKKRSEKR